MNVQGAIQCCTSNKNLIVNFLVLFLNLNLLIYNYHYPDFTFQHRMDVHSNERNFTCSITNQTVISQNNWTTLEAKVFASPLSSKDRQLLDRMFRAFVQTVEAANLTYFLSGGTLIGSLRHHGIIPWDDDIDVTVKESEKDALFKVLSKLGPDFKIYAMEPSWRHYWKLYPSQGRQLRSGLDYRTPFIDIFPYRENKTHVWISAPEWQTRNTWPKQHILPLQRRPFGELLVAAPCNSLAVVKSFTNISMCQSRSFDHLSIGSIRVRRSVPCDHLVHIYPFVKRSNATSHLVKEALMFGDLTIGEVMINNTC